jgi:hypothetical protein
LIEQAINFNYELKYLQKGKIIYVLKSQKLLKLPIFSQFCIFSKFSQKLSFKPVTMTILKQRRIFRFFPRDENPMRWDKIFEKKKNG